VYPKVSGASNSCNVLMNGNGASVNGQEIKPLVLEKVIVKAKKTKEVNMDDEKDEWDWEFSSLFLVYNLNP